MEKTNLYLLAIVGIVAVVAITVLIFGNRTTGSSEDDLDISGQAIKTSLKSGKINVVNYCLKEFHYSSSSADTEDYDFCNSFLGKGAKGYGCTANELDTTDLCPSGTIIGSRPSVLSYYCYGEEPFDFEGCLEGYELTLDTSQGGSSSDYYSVDCTLEGYVDGGAFDHTSPCGISGAEPAADDWDRYCCQY